MDRVSGWTLHRGPRSRSNVSCRDLSPSRFPTIFLGFCLILGVKLHRLPGELCEAGPKCPCWEVSCHTKGAGHPAWLLLSHWRRCRLREALSPWFFPCLSGEEVTQSECNCAWKTGKALASFLALRFSHCCLTYGQLLTGLLGAHRK